MAKEYIDKDRLILWMNDWMLQNAPIDARDDTTRADTILDAIKMVEDSPAANVRENVIRTNADKLRAMSDEELADVLDHIQGDAYLVGIGERKNSVYPGAGISWLDWLKSPVEEADNGGAD